MIFYAKARRVRRSSPLPAQIRALFAALILAASAGTALAQADIELPQVRDVPQTGTPMSATPMPMAENGYVEQEFFLEGEAARYRIADPMADATLIDDGHPYTTRVLVRRPTDPAHFNGTVIVEWLNVSLDQDIDFVFGATRELIVRDGYAWIGVSAQRNGVEAMRRWNPDRYGALNVAASNVDPVDGSLIDPPDPLIMAKGGDVLAWDIFSQVGRMAAAGAPDLLGDLRTEHVIAASESQSTLKVSTYYNAIQPLHQVYDGYLFYDRSGRLRTDTGTKSLAIGTEIFTILMQEPPQNDTDHQRWWEINGASHFSLDEIEGYVDPFITRDGLFRDSGGAAMSLSDMTHARGPCSPDTIYSRVPNGDIMKAALASLNVWIAGGPAPANAPRFVVDGASPPAYVRDDDGQILGGIRMAAQDAPLSRNAGIGEGEWFCGPSGYHVDFTPAELCDRYGNHDAYVDRVRAITNANMRDGVLLPEEAQATINDAQAVGFSCAATSP